ncbi:MAG: UDP-N-acetylenolpyruvoylglucosamine reductase [Hyphomicrobium sp.]|nr:MAG: UDP-N-acetylenolpyruvoylglucosamine reductase [Hyphomicrobium sp.]PPC99294.1 MAG: UDP-N-acetylenolpyruvoylglucosamine reductase [Hyphomicrobium sp.]
MFEDITADLRTLMPDLRGRLITNAPLADITWFRVGGPAQVLFTPADEADLAYFLQNLPDDVPINVIGLGSNLLVRDGGVPGIVIRLGRGFSEIKVEPEHRLRVGTAVPDVKVARAAADAGISGLAFYRGIPGSIGGALRMNAGAHGRETKDCLISARAVDLDGNIYEYSLADMGFTYRHCAIPEGWIFTEAVFQGTPGDPADILKEMDEVADYREKNQPIKERTGGSTFKNPPGNSAWKLVDAAGCRGLRIGGAKVSDMHCNFLINDQQASGEDVEKLGETVRARVKAASGITLNWEIIRLGLPRPGRPKGEALAEMP